jgi:hypothetical protein
MVSHVNDMGGIRGKTGQVVFGPSPSEILTVPQVQIKIIHDSHP